MKNLIKSILLFTLCLFVGNTVLAQPSKKAKNKKGLASSLLWKIEGKGISQPSYLFGTIHMTSQDKFEITEATKKAFNTSEQIVLELDMDDPQMQVQMMQQASMKGGVTLDSLLSEKHYKMMDDKVKATMKVSLDMFKTWQPMLISSFLYMDMIEGTPASYEGSFVQMAKEGEKEIFGLETIADQIGAFDAMGYESQADYLADMLDDWDKTVKEFTMLQDMYFEGNIQKLYDYSAGQFGEGEALEAFLDNRNKSWIEPIGEFAKDKTTFIAVGAAHLAGENGVINLLKKAGYKVTPVMD